jgi:hypothetical protein
MRGKSFFKKNKNRKNEKRKIEIVEKNEEAKNPESLEKRNACKN